MAGALGKGLATDEVSGIPRPEKSYNGSHLGFYRSLVTNDRNGKPIRSCSGNGYLASNAARTDLRVLAGTNARRVILEKDSTRIPVATGFELQHGGAYHSASAKREVILNDGALQNLQLLESSGIEDPMVLEEARIPCVVSNPNVDNDSKEHTMSAVVGGWADGVVSLDSKFRVVKEHQNLSAEKHSWAVRCY